MAARRPLMVLLVVIGLVAISWPLNILDVRARAPFASVASAFDAPPPSPGYGWSLDGRGPVEYAELATFGGPDHCHWQSATMMFIGWPLGTKATTFAQARYYLRDPQGVVGPEYRDRLVRNATLPADAKPTGYRLGPLQLYLSPADQDDAIYVVAPSGAERWPRVEGDRGLCL